MSNAYTRETDTSILVERGLPTDLTVNNSVRWLPPESFNNNPVTARFKGDSFTVGTSSDHYMLDSLSVFVAPGFKSANGTNNNPADLADWFQSTFLRIDQNNDGNLSNNETVSTGIFNAATDTIDNANISYVNTGQRYISANGARADIWEVTYSNLGLTFAADQTVSFGVKGIGREIGSSGFFFPWFLMAANADESGYTSGQNTSTDNAYLEFFADGTLEKAVDSGAPGGGWDKSSDILVKATGTLTEDPVDDINYVVGHPGDSSPIYGESQRDDFVIGRAGDSVLFGLSGNDTLKGDLEEPGGDDKLFGGQGDDLLLGGNGNDRLFGGIGHDVLKGEGDRDFLRGENGNDQLFGGTGNDVLKGERGRDFLRGGDGNDRLFGGTGNDVLKGDGGRDFLRGGKGRDTYTGGEGRDVFVLARGEGVDTITDFEAHVDRIRLGSGLSFNQIYRVQRGANAVISTFDGEVLSIVVDTNVSELTARAFF